MKDYNEWKINNDLKLLQELLGDDYKSSDWAAIRRFMGEFDATERETNLLKRIWPALSEDKSPEEAIKTVVSAAFKLASGLHGAHISPMRMRRGFEKSITRPEELSPVEPVGAEE